MIGNLFLNLIYWFLNIIIGAFPIFSGLPDGVNSAFDLLHNSLAGANSIFPMSTLIDIIGFVLIVESSVILFKTFNWIYNKVRGSG